MTNIYLTFRWSCHLIFSTARDPEHSYHYEVLGGPEPLYYVSLSVTPAVSGVCRADEEQKTKLGLTYSARCVFNFI